MSNRISTTIGLLRKLQNILTRPALLTIYKYFLRTHLGYGDIIYDQDFNLSFHQKLESIQYKVVSRAQVYSLFNCHDGIGNCVGFTKFIINKLLVTCPN